MSLRNARSKQACFQGENRRPGIAATSLAWPEIISAWVRPVGDVEITLPNSQGNQSFRSVAGKRSGGRAVYLGDPRLALLGRSPVGAEKSCAHDALPNRRKFCVFWESAVGVETQPKVVAPQASLAGLAKYRTKHPEASIVPPDFSFDGTSFTTTVAEFRKAHPRAKVGPQTNLNLEIEEYTSMIVGPASLVDVQYYKGRLHTIMIVYLPDDISRIGGIETLRDRLIIKYGYPRVIRPNGSLIFGNGNIYVELSKLSHSVSLLVADMDHQNRATRVQRSGSNTGF